MRKSAAILVVILSFTPLTKARGGLELFGLRPYSCTAGGFNLDVAQNSYRLTGGLYPPLSGYTYTFAGLKAIPTLQESEVTLTLIEPAHIIGLSELPRLAVVPPLWVDYSFYSNVYLHKLTIFLNEPFTHIDTKITCLQTGTTQ